MTAQNDALSKQLALQHDSGMKTIEAFRAEMKAEFAVQSADMRLEFQSRMAPLSERVAILEARQN